MNTRVTVGVGAAVLLAGAAAGWVWSRGGTAGGAGTVDPREREAACARTPPDAEACAAAGTMRLMSGDTAGAAQLAGRALAQEPDNLHARLLDAGILSATGHEDEAKSRYEAMEKSFPHSGLPAANLAMLALSSGDIAGASTAVEAALAADPKLSMAHAVKARILEQKEQPKEAADEYLTATALDPAALQPRLELADLYARRQHLPEALDVLRETAQVFPDSPVVHYRLGRLLDDTGDADAAAEELRRADELAPGDPAAGLALASLRLRQGESDFALARLREILQKHPGLIEAEYLLAEGLFDQGDVPGARAQLDGIIATKDASDRELVPSYRLRSRVRAKEGNLEGALADLAWILARNPLDVVAHAATAHLLLDAGRYSEAKPHVEVASKSPPPFPASFMIDRARLFAHDGRTADAVAELRKLKEQGKLDPLQVKAQPELRALAGNSDYELLFLQDTTP